MKKIKHKKTFFILLYIMLSQLCFAQIKEDSFKPIKQ
jgi:hypothetical protein